jgi:hypothetical protein
LGRKRLSDLAAASGPRPGRVLVASWRRSGRRLIEPSQSCGRPDRSHFLTVLYRSLQATDLLTGRAARRTTRLLRCISDLVCPGPSDRAPRSTPAAQLWKVLRTWLYTGGRSLCCQRMCKAVLIAVEPTNRGRSGIRKRGFPAETADEAEISYIDRE